MNDLTPHFISTGNILMDKFGLEGQGLTLDNILSNKDDATLSLQLMGENIFFVLSVVFV